MSDFQMETRRRSRSKTPFLRSNCDHENCEHAGEEGHVHHKKKSAAPKVQTIMEETIQQTTKSKTSDYSSEDNSPKIRANSVSKRAAIETAKPAASAATTTSSSSTTIVTKTRKVVSGGSTTTATATSTPKAIDAQSSFGAQFFNVANSASHRLKEVAQNEINTRQERSQQEANKSQESKRQQQSAFSRFLTKSFGSSTGTNESYVNGDASDHIAYLEYKRAGEYWKKTPKTDYTYSKLSPHRRQLAPGVVAMPNMSRRSLEQHTERIVHMISRDPAQEEYIRRRYLSSQEAAQKLAYDSGDELDYAKLGGKKRSSYNYWEKQEESWLTRIITTIVTTITSFWPSSLGANDSTNSSALYYTAIHTEKERGLLGSIGHGISAAFMGLMRNTYILISSVLCWDTWLLRSSNPDSRNKKRFLLFLLILLPLLLLAAWWSLSDSERLNYVQSAQALVPVTLVASLRTTLSSTGATLQSFSQLPLVIKSKASQLFATEGKPDLDTLQRNLQRSLTAEEYENLLNHVNSYVQKLVDSSVQQQQLELAQRAQSLSPAQIKIIAQIMHENLASFAQERNLDANIKLAALSDAEIQMLAARVLAQMELHAADWTQQPAKLTPAHLAEIQRLITEQIELNNHASYALFVEHIDLEALLARILNAPLLARYVDARVNAIVDQRVLDLKEEGSGVSATVAAHEQQRAYIDNLNQEIAFIKMALSDKVAENMDLQQSISKLQLGQNDLLLRLQQHELYTDERFSNLLAEIEVKLAALKDAQFAQLNQQVKLSLVEILGFKQTAAEGGKLTDADLQNWVHSIFVAKDYLEQQLLQFSNRTDDKIRAEIDRSGMLLMRDVSERLKAEILLAMEAKEVASHSKSKRELDGLLTESEVRKIVRNVLAIYDADKTGLVDFALESAGGQILSTRCTESYQTKTAQISVFGIPLWYPTNTPRVAISPNVQPGECWAFQGFPGFLVLKLNSLIYVTGFTVEHIPRSLSPNGRIESAPRNFTVWGLEHEKDQEPMLFGEYEYVDNDASLQYFPVQNSKINRPYDIVELRIESNHGHQLYTCLYRFRVHGKPPPA